MIFMGIDPGLNKTGVGIVYADKIIKALNICKGYTEYRVKDIANDLGFTKTKVKYLVKQAIEENKLELLTIENVTFLRPIL